MRTTEIILNFRSALLAVLPMVERVGIPWRSGDAYDEWDAVAAALFEALVVDVFRWSLFADRPDALQMPPYDMILKSYSEHSAVEIDHPSLPGGRKVFHSFGTSQRPLDQVLWLPVTDLGEPKAMKPKPCSVQETEFLFRPQNSMDRLVDQIDHP